VPSKESKLLRGLGDVAKHNLSLNNSERINKFSLNDHSVSVLSTKVIMYLESALNDKTLSRNAYVFEYNN
jgi:hypothetical protein